jgi:hypothetical protein
MSLCRFERAVLVALFASALLFCCSGAGKEWDLARRLNTREAYLGFAETHPDSKFAAEAKEQIVEMERLEAAINSYMIGITTYEDAYEDKGDSWTLYCSNQVKMLVPGRAPEVTMELTIGNSVGPLCTLIFEGSDLLTSVLRSKNCAE